MEQSKEESQFLTSFAPLSPESSKGFSFSRLFDFARKKPEEVSQTKPARNLETELTDRASAAEVEDSEISDTINAFARSTSEPGPPSRVNTSSRLESSGKFTSSTSAARDDEVSNYRPDKSPSGYRNLPAVLKRLSVLSEKRDQIPQSFRQSDFKQYWMPDENCKECYECGDKFNTFRRRHHCRLCGQIFCSRCCKQGIPGHLMGCTGDLRVCIYCFKIVQTYTLSPDAEKNLEVLHDDIRAVSDHRDSMSTSSSSINLSKSASGFPFDLEEEERNVQMNSRKASMVSVSAMANILTADKPTPNVRSPFDYFGVSAAEADLLKQDSLRELWHEIMSSHSGIELQSHRFRLKTYHNCLVGSELVDWLLHDEKVSNRNQAVTIGQALLDTGWLEPVPNTRDGRFKDDYILFQPGQVAVREVSSRINSPVLSTRNGENDCFSNSDVDEREDDDDDDTMPVWFRQLSDNPISFYASVEEIDHDHDGTYTAFQKRNSLMNVRQLDLDWENFAPKESANTELSLKVKLDRSVESTLTNGSNTDEDTTKLSLITVAPPPPLEKYAYVEGIAWKGEKKQRQTSESGSGSAKPETPDEVMTEQFANQMTLQLDTKPLLLRDLREDNGERQAMERLRTSHQYHITRLLEQLLQDAGLKRSWKEVILPLVLKVSETVCPDVRRDDDMDIRQYIKFKKIPGGRKQDCQLVSGVVCSKNIVHKKMATIQGQPKILILSCAIDYQRVETKLASLDPLVLQENDFLKNFIARVVALKPTLVLVEKSVSRLAQEMLLKHGITLALNMKPQVLDRVGRCTRAEVLPSMEQVSRPKLGTCQLFRVQKFQLPDGRSKPLMYFEGCPPSLFCTVTLRGGSEIVLAKVKQIMNYMIYVAYNSKLEISFLMDEFSMPPSPSELLPPAKSLDLNEDDEHSVFQNAMAHVVLSSSPFMKYPVPYLLTPNAGSTYIRSYLTEQIYYSKHLHPENSDGLFSDEESEDEECNPKQKNSKLSDKVIIKPLHPLLTSLLTVPASDISVRNLLADYRAGGGGIHLREKSHCDGVTWQLGDDTNEQQEDNILHINADYSYQQQAECDGTKMLPTAIHLDHKVECLDPYKHQKIPVLFSSYSSESNNSPRPCISPWAVFMEYYGRNDITLGGFLERYCFRPSYICPNPNCDIPMVHHVRYFAHGTGSVYIHMRDLESPIPGYDHTILTWSWCKECKQVTPVVPLSAEAWALSFAKYLELRFYGEKYRRRASVEPCPHSLHHNHFQYFGFANMVASFKYRTIHLFEVAIPPLIMTFKDTRRDPQYWMQDIQVMAARGDEVFTQVSETITSLHTELQLQENRTQQFRKDLGHEYDEFHEHVHVLEIKASALFTPESSPSSSPKESPTQPSKAEAFLTDFEATNVELAITDGLTNLKRLLSALVDNWNKGLQELFQTEKKKVSKQGSSGSPTAALPADNGTEELVTPVKDPDKEYTEETVTVANGDFTPYTAVSVRSKSCPENPEDFIVQSYLSRLQNSADNAFKHSCTDVPDQHDVADERCIGDDLDTSCRTSLQYEENDAHVVIGVPEIIGVEEISPGIPTPIHVENESILETAFETSIETNAETINSKEQTDTSIPLEKGGADININETNNIEEQMKLPNQTDKIECTVPNPLNVLSSDEISVTTSTDNKHFGNKNDDDKRKPRASTLTLPPTEPIVKSTDGSSSPVVTRRKKHFAIERPQSEILSSDFTIIDLPKVTKCYSDTEIHSVCKRVIKYGNSDLSTESPTTTLSETNVPELHNNPAIDSLKTQDPEGSDSEVESISCSNISTSLNTNNSNHAGSSRKFKKGHVRSRSWAASKWRNVTNQVIVTEVKESKDSTDGMSRKRDKVKNIISQFLPANYQPIPAPFPPTEHHLLPACEGIPIFVSEKEASSIIAYTLSIKEYAVQLQKIQQYLNNLANELPSTNHQSMQRAKKDKIPLSRGFSSGSDVLHNLSPTEGPHEINFDEYVNIDESLVATNSSESVASGVVNFYRTDLSRVDSVPASSDVAEIDTVTYSKGKASQNSLKIDESHFSATDECDAGAEYGFPRKDDNPKVDFHIKHHFSDSTGKFYCSVYFAEQFRQLRKDFYPLGEGRFIRSLQHCMAWRARGGKSGSTFNKSVDDRFILKQMSRLELQSFMEFAPHYFQYMKKAYQDQRPTVMAKILGVFRIGFKNSQTTASLRQDVLVMENLFYDRKIDKIFDLKGSMRSRYVQSSGKENDVLMDENLLEMIRENPLFIRPYSKTIMSRAIHNDTEFLAQHMVMDYSLLVGIDQTNTELVIGIIDYIRTFTWDKKLEMYVKSSGILGGQGKMPTVVSPELYRKRFTEAMQRYILMVPDKWTGLGNELD